jgi:hypothetical protein
MITINITTEQGELLGQTTLSSADISIMSWEVTQQSKVWIAEKILAELPHDTKALLACLGEGPDAED